VVAVATWGEERLRAVDRTLSLLPDFAQAQFLAAMVFVARQAFGTAEALIAKGAARQTQEAETATAPFPSFGLHWLHGLVLLHRGAVGDALRAFVREIDTGRETSVYYPEFRLNATIASGFAHLSANDGDGAVRAFREALGQQPANGRGLIGLHKALIHVGAVDEGTAALRRVAMTVAELTTGGRDAEAALIRAAAATTAGEHDAALSILDRLLDHAPLGQVGWQLAIDPALTDLRTAPGFERLVARVAARAS
jgi:tetratricopeptide (TPR) repeat protein